MTVITRFPPSPTGFMHIGTARTALFNWLYARHTGGKFFLRIEDTDRERHSDAAVDAIFKGLEWLGMDWDNEDVVFQSQQKDRHVQIAKQLLKEGKAYHCYCTPEELEEMRKKARTEGRGEFYDRRWRNQDSSPPPKGIKPVVRIKSPLQGNAVIRDMVQGYVRLDNRNIDDFIILRSDGTPTYMLAVVVDDHDMGITHVIRGDDHLNNTFRQNVLYDSLGWKIPEYAHIPLIHGTDGTKFSKRHGAQSIEDYRDMGFLPEAMRNYLLRLGWGHGDAEIISPQDAIRWFDLSGVGKSPSRFDMAKLENLNAHYIKARDDESLFALLQPLFIKQRGLETDPEKWNRLKAGLGGLKQRARTLNQIVHEGAFYLRESPFIFDSGADQILTGEAITILKALRKKLDSLPVFEDTAIEKACRALATEQAHGKLAAVAMPLRAALTGTDTSPPIFKAAEILGKKETLLRLDMAIEIKG